MTPSMSLDGKMLAIYASLVFVLTEAQNVPEGPHDFVNQKRTDEYQLPVPFGHIYKEGFGNPYSDLKQPLDLLELDMRMPRNEEEARILLQKTNPNKIQFFKRPGVSLTREAFLNDDGDENEGRPGFMKNKTDDWPKLPNLAEIQMSNARTPHPRNTRKGKKKTVSAPDTRRFSQRDDIPKSQFFAPGEFDLPQDRGEIKVNWTTCEEFGGKVFLNPRDIVDIEWVPFYVWSIRPIRNAIVHIFSYPTKKLVKQYYEDYHLHLNKTVDWQQPKLLMKERNEVLLIAVDKRGSFVGIHKQALPSSVKGLPIIVPSVNIRIRIDDPYLLMMFCDEYYAVIMAVSGNEPATYKDKIAEAATSEFKGSGRPVWRDLRAEKETKESERRQELIEEENKMIKISEDFPPIF